MRRQCHVEMIGEEIGVEPRFSQYENCGSTPISSNERVGTGPAAKKKPRVAGLLLTSVRHLQDYLPK